MKDNQFTWDGPIIDNHFHLNRQGRFLEAAKDFKNSGGTGLVQFIVQISQILQLLKKGILKPIKTPLKWLRW